MPRLDGDVERGGRLVGDDAGGARPTGHGDEDALEHAAGELVRVLLQPALGRAEVHLFQQRRWRGPRGLALDSAAVRRAGSPRPSAGRSVATGLSAVIGSWGMSATARPRSSLMALRVRDDVLAVDSADPEMTARSSGSSRSSAMAVVDLPEPDSPMIVTVSPWSM